MGELASGSSVLRAVGIALAFWGAPLSAAAQGPDPASVADPADDPSGRALAEARHLFDEGYDALMNGRALEGRELLRRSIQLHPTIPARFNFAVALRATQQPLEAMTEFQSLLAGEHGPLSEGQRDEVVMALDAVRKSLVRLKVTVPGSVQARVDVDGRGVGTAGGVTPLDAYVTPGRHRVSAQTPAGRASTDIDVAAGTDRSIELVIVPSAPVQTSDTREPLAPLQVDSAPESDRGGWPAWVWITGSVALVTAVAVVTAVVVSSSAQADPVTGDIDGVVETLRW